VVTIPLGGHGKGGTWQGGRGKGGTWQGGDVARSEQQIHELRR